MIDWQNIVVMLIVLGAALYVVRRGWSRFRSFRASGDGGAAASCTTGCGGCANNQQPAAAATTPVSKTLVQLSRSHTGSSRTSR
ncbi:MAG: FeoB-associated Cys-rich membrane protein [Acidobacteriota bacterium]|nr:FeoB-associated Cys-rich membrane protein [Acidobacteriota bacterium]